MSPRFQNIGKCVLAAYIAAILYLCLASWQGIPGMWKTFLGIQMDKVFHFLMYLPYPFLAFWAFYKGKDGGLFLLKVLLVGMAYGGAVELMQALFTDSRSAEWGDWLANTAGMGGSALLIGLGLIIYRRRKK